MPKHAPHWFFAGMRKFNTLLAVNCPPGPNFIPWYYIINLQKGGTVFFCLWLMTLYDNWSVSAVVYTACHGSYGLCWLLKHFAFRDRNWDVPTTIMGQINSLLAVLGPYLYMPYLLISRSVPAPSNITCLCAAITYVLGVVIMCVADAHKHFVLKAKKGLITDGLFAYTRNPNYLGEIILYGSFAAMVGSLVCWAHLIFVWILVFYTNMKIKDASMSRYPAWDEYVARTGLLFPRPSILFDLIEGGANKKKK